MKSKCPYRQDQYQYCEAVETKPYKCGDTQPTTRPICPHQKKLAQEAVARFITQEEEAK